MNAKILFARSIAGASFAFVVAACAHTGDRPTEVSTTSGTVRVANGDAIAAMGNARCEREARCNNIGKGQTFASQAECSKEATTSAREAVNEEQCPKGIYKKELDECLSAIRSDECNNPLDHIVRLAACRPVELCGGGTIGSK